MRIAHWMILFGVSLLTMDAAALPRDKTEYQRFRKENPCPSTGRAKGPCKGYQVDHKTALMNGGRDEPANMQWVNKEDHRHKTRQDIAQCKASGHCLHRGLSKK